MKFKLGTLAAALLLATGAASAATTISTAGGEFSLKGDVEVDNDYVDQEGVERNYRRGGRVRLQADAYKEFGNKYVQARGQAMLGVEGNTWTDDAWLEFGQLNGLALRVGTFEALDVYPLGQDIIVDFARDTLTPFDAVYIYRANELRGRGGPDFGQAMLTYKAGDNLHFELSTLIGSNTNFLTKYQLDNFRGGIIEAEDKDAVGLRPGIEFKTDLFRLAAVMEFNLNAGTIEEVDPETGETISIISLSDRMGGGINGSFFGDGYTINANVAYLDAEEAESYSGGLNAVIADFGLGYVYAKNDNTASDIDPDSNTLYASYAFNNLMGIEDLAMKLGVFYSLADGLGDGNQDVENKGGRLRFNYTF